MWHAQWSSSWPVPPSLLKGNDIEDSHDYNHRQNITAMNTKTMPPLKVNNILCELHLKLKVYFKLIIFEVLYSFSFCVWWKNPKFMATAMRKKANGPLVGKCGEEWPTAMTDGWFHSAIIKFKLFQAHIKLLLLSQGVNVHKSIKKGIWESKWVRPIWKFNRNTKKLFEK